VTRNRRHEVAAHDAELWELLATGKVVPHVGAVFPLAEGARALDELAARRATGKVLVVPENNGR
jgi:NADPH2:quinone reductase